MDQAEDASPAQERPAPDWVNFTCRIADAPAMITLDAGWMGHQGFAGATRLLLLQVPFNTPPGERIVTAEELPQLQAIIDAVEASLPAQGAFLLGMVHTGGMLEISVFTLDEVAVTDAALAAIRALGTHRARSRIVDDPTWGYFTEFLWPDPLSWQRIGNWRLCRNLASNGDPGLVARMIDHAAFFPDRRSAERFASAVTRLGLEVTKLAQSDEQVARGGPFIVEFGREDIPAALDPLATELFLTARDHGGRYDGWGCMVLKPEA